MMIKEGGQVKSLSKDIRVKEVRVTCPDKDTLINLWINTSCLSYLSVEEAIGLRDEIEEAVKVKLRLKH